MSAEPTYVYGWGRTKHIVAPDQKPTPWRLAPALCGAYGGRPEDPKRPVCKHCLRLSASSVRPLHEESENE